MNPVKIAPVQAGSVLRTGISAEPEPKVSRIAFLDGLRCLALILAVIPFHYFRRWTPPYNQENLYPYGHALASFFPFGDYGVELFFVISGFVIMLTLYKCNSIGEFFTRRVARLFPAMVLCSIITFMITSTVPDGNAFRVTFASFLPSWTFTEPTLYNTLFSTTVFSSVDGAYWSLSIEAQFYLLISITYFLSRKHFLRNIVVYSMTTYLLESIFDAYFLRTGAHWAHALHWVMHVLQASDYLPWFLLGIGFYLYSQRKGALEWCTPAALGFIQLLISSGGKGEAVPVLPVIAIPCIFFASMTAPLLGRILSCRPFVQIGAASYSLFLLHQNAGVTLIRYFSKALALGAFASAALAFVVALAMIACSLLIYQVYERRANKFLLTILLPNKKSVVAPALV